MSPASLVTGFTISGLPPVITTATELPGGLFEVEVLVGPPNGLQAYMNKRLTLEQLTDYITAQMPATGSGTIALPLSLTAAQARIINSPPDPKVVSNILYAITSTTWNGNTPATVYVHGLNATTYAPTGWVLDANDAYQEVRVNVAAGTFDTEPLRDLQLFQASELDLQTGQVTLWVGDAATADAVIKEILLP